jgi:hypothetical protein
MFTNHRFLFAVGMGFAAGFAPVKAQDTSAVARPLPPGAQLSTKFLVGTDRKRQIHAFDPDGTRIEIMEPAPPDGVPAPLSPAPPPS